MDMAQDVEVPQRLDPLVAVLHPAVAQDAGIGAEQVDRPETLLGPARQSAKRGLVPDVEREGDTTHVGGHPLGLVRVNVGHDHRPGAAALRGPGQPLADARTAPVTHDDAVRELHPPIVLPAG
jgi:hypothetical protein